MNLLLLTAHSIAEYDDLRMFTDMGIDVFSIGAYTNPAFPGDTMRPALPGAPYSPGLEAKCIEQREKHAEESKDWREWAVDPAKADLHPDIIEWADVIVAHHYLDRWIVPQWSKIRDKRVIWRTCGQSDPELEMHMTPLVRQGLQVVRYSPKERDAFGSWGTFAGEDTLIRFGKYPSDYGPWIGDEAVVGNITQDMYGRGQGAFDACGLRFWLAATDGLAARPAGPGSENLPGGIGALDYPEMIEYLRRIRAYLYTGTVPASYTLGLIEAMMSGVPVVSIGVQDWQGPEELFEGGELTGWGMRSAQEAHHWLRYFLDGTNPHNEEKARTTAERIFGIERVSGQWAEFLGAGVPVRTKVAA